VSSRSWLLLLVVLLLRGALPAQGETRPPIEIPGLREAQAQDQAIWNIDEQLRKGEWGPARTAASELLARAKVTLHGSLQPALVRLAIAEAGLGLEEEARRHWQAIQALGGGSWAASIAAPFGAAAKLGSLPSRAYGQLPPGVEGAGARPGYSPPHRAGGALPQVPAGCTGTRGPLWARFQAVIDAQGHLTLPAIVGSSVCFSNEVLQAAQGWSFEPAHRDGVPVAGQYDEEIHPPGQRPFRELAAGGAGPLEVASLLAAGKGAEAEARAEAQWNAALDAGSPSRAATVTLLALRAVVLAAHDDAETRSLAVCLWQAAQGEEPALYDLDLSPFGKAGERLAEHRFGASRVASRAEDAAAIDAADAPIARPQILPETKRPPRKRFPTDSYPAGSRVFIEGFVDETGALRDPFLLDRPEGLRGLDLEALATVCSWRFRPAQRAGRAVGLTYLVTLGL
jgi:hypothetical protein